MEDESVHIESAVCERQFRLCSRQADRTDEQPAPFLLMGEDMFNPSADAVVLAIGVGCGL